MLAAYAIATIATIAISGLVHMAKADKPASVIIIAR